MTVWVKIRVETASGLARKALRPFQNNARPSQEAGWVEIPLEEDTYERLLQKRFPGETDDDLIVRVLQEGKVH